MTRTLRIPALLRILALLLAAFAAQPSAQPASQPALGERIPFDTAVTTGTLPNGLRYYIRRNTRPEKRVALQLAVKAGSVDEADDQQGLAHLLEHMAFNGTKRFKPGDLAAPVTGAGWAASTPSLRTIHVRASAGRHRQAFRRRARRIALPRIDKARVIEECGAPRRDGCDADPSSSNQYAGAAVKPEILKTFSPKTLQALHERTGPTAWLLSRWATSTSPRWKS